MSDQDAFQTNESTADGAAKCPFLHGESSAPRLTGTLANKAWWPNMLNLKLLAQNNEKVDPMGDDFDYREEFLKVDLDELKKDIEEVMTTSQDWWPADYGHYGPFFIRMAWHSAGTYRIADGRGGGTSGTLRFAPLNSWPDNGNLDKARKLLWPIKQKYGRKLSWADLMIFTGNCAIESMGLPLMGFAGGREDVWEPEEDIWWGPERTWLGNERYSGDRELMEPLGAVQMGLIYVNPEGPDGAPNPLASARDIRETFGRMAMNDEETVALIAGGHTFGKGHGAADPEKYVGAEPEGAPLEEQGLGWKNSFGTGAGADTITSGLEGAWTTEPTKWDNNYLENLFGHEWKQTKSPAGATIWIPVDADGPKTPDAHNEGQQNSVIMYTSDLALREDPAYEKIARRFSENFEEFSVAFSKAWHKLTHRDMGPYSWGLGSMVPAEPQLWQDPTPEVDHDLIDDSDAALLKGKILDSDLTVSQLVKTAWASAASFRGSDRRGGTDGARLRLSPQKFWAANDLDAISAVLPVLEQIQADFNESGGSKKVSLADLIVLAGNAAVEKAAKDGGQDAHVPFTPGRTDATAEQTDVESFAVLEPKYDAFRNYLQEGLPLVSEELLVDRAQLLTLTAPEMTVLLGGMRVLGANTGDAQHGVFTDRVGVLSNDFFSNLLSMDLEWSPTSQRQDVFEAKCRTSGEVKWTGTRADLVLGSNSQLRALSEVYACSDSQEKFTKDFVAAWAKVMNLGRLV